MHSIIETDKDRAPRAVPASGDDGDRRHERHPCRIRADARGLARRRSADDRGGALHRRRGRRRSAGRSRAHAPSPFPACPICTATPSSAAWPGAPSCAASRADSFWTWRDSMYRFALTMTPDDVEAVAGQALCRDAGGRLHPRRRVPLSAPRSRRAALCRSGRDGDAHRRGRRRDRHRPDAAAGVLRPREFRRRSRRRRASAGSSTTSTASRACSKDAGRRAPARRTPSSASRRTACAPSTPDELAAVCALAGDGPIHIHAAEQVREVEDCLAWSGAPAGRMAARPRARSTRAGA